MATLRIHPSDGGSGHSLSISTTDDQLLKFHTEFMRETQAGSEGEGGIMVADGLRRAVWVPVGTVYSLEYDGTVQHNALLL
jgi:hypothetical protein